MAAMCKISQGFGFYFEKQAEINVEIFQNEKHLLG
jgi:hypothetical protein